MLTRRLLYDACGCLAIFLLAACSVPGTQVSVPPPLEPRVTQTGIASWYGPGFHGKITASGTIYDQHGLTAAHKTLPLGTRILVTNLNNGKSTEVTISDRGPFAKDRILDLSYAAAQALGMLGEGTIPVRIEVLDGPYKIEKIRARMDYTLQFGSFSDMEKAAKLKDLLAKTFPQPSEIVIVPFRRDDATYYRVQAGVFSDRDDAEIRARQLAGKGFSPVIMEK
jgi:peptidoglycan lytic transglycosylase